ncbi:MAG: hypothetical protein CME62_04570 [Halobacteriovoraceae bacterium]|nr:hypothetical protein [Halobacteriovoraceae bacterium]|tara:strand:- start:7693 stop:7983 length:291 start_codon:yes stop_codon:yes gene_type:complete
MKILKLLLILLPFTAQAEYRVYQYMITNLVLNSQEEPKSHIVESTLNPSMYHAYHGGTSLIEISLLRTWRCVGNTAKKSICPSPYAKLTQGDLSEI